MFSLFKPADPREQAKKWKSEMRGEARKLDRQIGKIQREEAKARAETAPPACTAARARARCSFVLAGRGDVCVCARARAVRR